MTEFDKYRKAKGIINQRRLKPMVLNPDRSLYIFEITEPHRAITIVNYNTKGWICDYQESNDDYLRRTYQAKKHNLKTPDRFSHSQLYGKEECSHILACKIYLKAIGINIPEVTDYEIGESAIQEISVLETDIPRNAESPRIDG